MNKIKFIRCISLLPLCISLGSSLYISSLYTCIYSGLARAIISIQVLFITWYIEPTFRVRVHFSLSRTINYLHFVPAIFLSRLPLGNMCLSPVHIVFNSWLQSARFSLGSKCAARAGAVTASSSRTMRAAGVREGPSTICTAAGILGAPLNLLRTAVVWPDLSIGPSAHNCGFAGSAHWIFCRWFVIWLCSDPI
jgi:hypothetical protein